MYWIFYICWLIFLFFLTLIFWRLFRRYRSGRNVEVRKYLGVRKLVLSGDNPTTSSCANRVMHSSVIDGKEFTFTWRDPSRPDGYSRTELLQMLTVVRKHELQQGWWVAEAPTNRALLLDFAHGLAITEGWQVVDGVVLISARQFVDMARDREQVVEELRSAGGGEVEIAKTLGLDAKIGRK